MAQELVADRDLLLNDTVMVIIFIYLLLLLLLLLLILLLLWQCKRLDTQS